MKKLITLGIAACMTYLPIGCDKNPAGPDEITLEQNTNIKTPLNMLYIVEKDLSSHYNPFEDSLRTVIDPCKVYREGYEKANSEIRDTVYHFGTGTDTFSINAHVNNSVYNCFDSTFDPTYTLKLVKPLETRIKERNAKINLHIMDNVAKTNATFMGRDLEFGYDNIKIIILGQGEYAGKNMLSALKSYSRPKLDGLVLSGHGSSENVGSAKLDTLLAHYKKSDFEHIMKPNGKALLASCNTMYNWQNKTTIAEALCYFLNSEVKASANILTDIEWQFDQLNFIAPEINVLRYPNGDKCTLFSCRDAVWDGNPKYFTTTKFMKVLPQDVKSELEPKVKP